MFCLGFISTRNYPQLPAFQQTFFLQPSISKDNEVQKVVLWECLDMLNDVWHISPSVQTIYMMLICT